MSNEEQEPKVETMCHVIEAANQMRIVLQSTQILLWAAVMNQGGEMTIDPKMLTRAQLNCDNYAVSEDVEGNILIKVMEYCSTHSASFH